MGHGREAIGRLRVLVVDSSPIVRNLLAEYLKAAGLCETVSCAGDGASAALAAEQGQVDLVVMDMSVPSVCAISSTRIIKALDNAPKVILLCQHEGVGHKRRAQAAGADGYISKLDCVDELAPLVLKLFLKRALSKRAVRKRG